MEATMPLSSGAPGGQAHQWQYQSRTQFKEAIFGRVKTPGAIFHLCERQTVVASQIGGAVAERRKPSDDPSNRGLETVLGMLKDLPKNEREVLRRFYLLGHSPRQICRDLKLTEAEFAAIKRRAREKFDRARLGEGDREPG
jgi:DNA-directed RNA polymerase specialized sigma24 family protein